MNLKHEAAVAAPSAAVVVWHWILGQPLQYWTAASGLILILLQIAFLLWRWYREVKKQIAEEED